MDSQVEVVVHEMKINEVYYSKVSMLQYMQITPFPSSMTSWMLIHPIFLSIYV